MIEQVRDYIPAIRNSALRYAVRVSVAGLVSYFLAVSLSLPQGYWAVITAIVVMQNTVGGSLAAALDRLTGTLLGAAVGFGVAVLHLDGYAAGLALAIALAPLAYAASVSSRFRVAPMTAAIMLIGVGESALDPVDAAVGRVLEILLGSSIGATVALFVLPARAESALTQKLAELLRLFSEAIEIDRKAICEGGDKDAKLLLNRRTRRASAQAEMLAEEAKQEISAHLASDIETGPLLRTVRRLRTNLLLIGRATAGTWPDHARQELSPAIDLLFPALSAHLLVLAEAMEFRRSVPPNETLRDALQNFDATVQKFRANPASDEMAADETSRVFALAFAVDQFRRDARDLTNRLNERADGLTAPTS
ncbi:MAG: FUSC family protein [Parvibaculum sp.]